MTLLEGGHPRSAGYIAADVDTEPAAAEPYQQNPNPYQQPRARCRPSRTASRPARTPAARPPTLRASRHRGGSGDSAASSWRRPCGRERSSPPATWARATAVMRTSPATQYTKNLCDATKLEAFQKEYKLDTDSTATTHYGSRQKGLDQSYCSHKLKDPEAAAGLVREHVRLLHRPVAQGDRPGGRVRLGVEGVRGPVAEDVRLYDEGRERLRRRGVSGDREERTDKDSLTSMTLAVRAGLVTIQTTEVLTAPRTKYDPADRRRRIRKTLGRSDTRRAMETLKKK